MNSPCLDCEKRRVEVGYNCHSHCKEYLAYTEERKRVNKIIQKTHRFTYMESDGHNEK